MTAAPGGFAAQDSRYAELIAEMETAQVAVGNAVRLARLLADEPTTPAKTAEVRKALHHTLHRLRPVASIVTEQYVRLGAL